MTKGKTRKNGGRNIATIGNRGPSGHAYAAINAARMSDHKGRHGFSQNADRVRVQTTRAEFCGEAILQPDTPREYSDTSGNCAPISMPHYSRGLYFTASRRVVVSMGSSGFGFLIVRHDLTGSPGEGGSLVAGAIGSNFYADIMASSGYSGTTFPALFNPDVSDSTVFITSSCNLGPMDVPDMLAAAAGSYCYSCTGQVIKLAANRSSVTSRKGSIVANHFPQLPKTDMSIDSFQLLPRANDFDAADLTEDSQFMIKRPPLWCGKTTVLRPTVAPANARPWGTGGGAMSSQSKQGWTVLLMTGNPNDEYVFEIETSVVYSGLLVPIQLPICYDMDAYVVVACALAKATRGSSTTTEADASKVGREVHRDMERVTTSFVPEYIHDTLFSVGGKMLQRAIQYAASGLAIM